MSTSLARDRAVVCAALSTPSPIVEDGSGCFIAVTGISLASSGLDVAILASAPVIANFTRYGQFEGALIGATTPLYDFSSSANTVLSGPLLAAFLTELEAEYKSLGNVIARATPNPEPWKDTHPACALFRAFAWALSDLVGALSRMDASRGTAFRFALMIAVSLNEFPVWGNLSPQAQAELTRFYHTEFAPVATATGNVPIFA